MTGLLLRGRSEDTHTHRGVIMWGHWEKKAVYKPKRETQRKPTLPTSWSWTYSLQNCEKIKLSCLSPQVYGMWYGNPRKQLEYSKKHMTIFVYLLLSGTSESLIGNSRWGCQTQRLYRSAFELTVINPYRSCPLLRPAFMCISWEVFLSHIPNSGLWKSDRTKSSWLISDQYNLMSVVGRILSPPPTSIPWCICPV